MGNAKKHVRLITVCLFVAVTMLFTGCGGGGDSEPVSEGRFVDSPVAGLRFETESRDGITGSEGKFTYLEGEMISFSIGDIYLGKTLAKPVITPLDLVEWAADETDASVTNICRFLQTLDDDGEPDNGILINESVRRGASGISVNFDTDVSAFGDDAQIQQTVSSLTAFTSAGQRPLQNAEQARQHFRNSLGLPENDDPDIPEVVTDSDITDAGEVSDNTDDIPEPAADSEDVPIISDDTPVDNADSDDGGSDAGNAGEIPPDTDTQEPVTNPEPVDNSGNTNENPPVTDTDNSGYSIVTPTVPDTGTETPEPITEPEPADNSGSTDENPTVPDTTTETPEPVTEPEPDDNTGNTGDTPTVPDSGTDTPEPVTEPAPTDNSGNTGETPTVPDSG
ncbi:MAG: hypothetical protein V2I97_02300, partial [Desulfococcaceae bacterium]|nr:hypothetical protein [Desulfococcaceae bacterium]